MKNVTNKFYIGIDSGGTKCDLIIIDVNKKILFSKSFPAFHYSVFGAEFVSEYISKKILSFLKSRTLDFKDCSGICVGLAGAREDKDKRKLLRTFKKTLNFKNIDIKTDTMTGLYGAFEEEDGVILICGTGSVLLGKSNDKIYRVGGWGRIIGDYGSGYEIGKKALIEIAKEYDLSVLKENESALSKKIKDRFKIDKQNIVKKVFHENFEIQKIAPIVLKCAKEKDKTCLKIIDDAVEGLLYHLHTFLKISRRRKPIDLVFIGSIIENKNILSEKLKKEIDKIFKNKIKVVPKKYSSAHGAALIAKKTFQ